MAILVRWQYVYTPCSAAVQSPAHMWHFSFKRAACNAYLPGTDELRVLPIACVMIGPLAVRNLFWRYAAFCRVSTCLQTVGVTNALQVCALRPLSAALQRMATTGLAA